VRSLHPALATLARLKLRAWGRRLVRRMRTPAGALFGVLGLALTALWLWSVFARASSLSDGIDPAQAEALGRGALLVFAVVVAMGSLVHRGLYFPPDELERLLTAPVTRSDLVRYRLVGMMARSALFGVLMGLLVAPRMPVPVFGFLGAALGLLTLPIAGQGVAILLGDAENRVGRFASRLPRGAARLVAGLGLWGVIMLFVMGDDLVGSGGIASDANPAASSGAFLGRVTSHPLFVALTLPFAPWAKAMAATGGADFALWFALALVLTVVLFEGVARLPIDFRELSLATSADVARRLARLRSGRGTISGGDVSSRALGRRVPWIFGRRPFGAVAWLECCAILRKARGTLAFAVLVAVFAVWISTVAFQGTLDGAIFLAILGTVYLSSGLRFDFRGRLDQMEVVRSWPLTPWKVFLATLLPETLLTGLLVAAAVLARSAILGDFPLEVGLVALACPLVTLVWLAVDNAVFLLVPVRFEPGQASAMHNAGRTLTLTLLRMLVLALLIGAVLLAAWVGASVGGALFGPGPAALVCAILAGLTTTVVVLAAVVLWGGWALARFDVAHARVSA